MTDVRDIVEFTSAKFSPVLPDESQGNPGRYGAELAFWLCIELGRRGLMTSYPAFEDWGWYLEYNISSGEFAVLCGNVDGSNDRWLLSLRRYGRKLFGRDKPPFDSAEALVTALRKFLAEESSIKDLNWLWDGGAHAG
jgi:hypothetical protein